MNDWLIRGYSGSITSSKKVWGCYLVWRVSVIGNIAPFLCPNKENVFRNLDDNCQYYLFWLAKGYFLSNNIYGTRDIFHLICFWNISVILLFVYVVYIWALLSKTIEEQEERSMSSNFFFIVIIIVKRILKRRKSLKRRNLRRETRLKQRNLNLK